MCISALDISFTTNHILEDNDTKAPTLCAICAYVCAIDFKYNSYHIVVHWNWWICYYQHRWPITILKHKAKDMSFWQSLSRVLVHSMSLLLPIIRLEDYDTKAPTLCTIRAYVCVVDFSYNSLPHRWQWIGGSATTNIVGLLLILKHKSKYTRF